MGRRNVLITVAVLSVGGAVLGFAATASGNTTDLDAELGPAVVASAGTNATARNLTPADPLPATATPSSIRSSLRPTDDDDDDEAQKVTAPRPRQLVDDEDEPDEPEGDDCGDDDGDDD